MGTIKDTVLKKMEALNTKAEKIKEGYARSSAETVKEYNQAEEAYQEAYENYRLAYKSFVMGEITKDSLKELEKVKNEAEEVLRDLGYKLDVIEQYLKEDLLEVTAEASLIQEDFNKESAIKHADIHFKMQQMKLDYLQSLHEAKKEYDRIYTAQYTMATLQEELGLKKGIYVGSPADTFNDGSNLIDRQEVFSALRGQFPSGLLQNIKDGKEKGYLTTK